MEPVTEDAIHALQETLLREAFVIASEADEHSANVLSDAIGDALAAGSYTRAEVFLAMTQVLAGVLAQEHCADCRKLHGSRLVMLACVTADKHMEGTRH